MRMQLITAFLLLAGTQFSQAFYQTPLSNLKHKSDWSLADFQGKTLLVSLFEPECRWCHRQMATLNQVVEQCDKQLQPVAVGIGGRKLALIKEIRRAQATFPAAQASPDWLNAIDDVPATPWMLVVNSQGELLQTVRGYIDLERIKQAFPHLCKATQDSPQR